jgi:hypothetical protein
MNAVSKVNLPEYLTQFRCFQSGFQKEWGRDPVVQIEGLFIDQAISPKSVGIRFDGNWLGVSEIITTSPKHTIILKYAATLTFLTEPFRQNRMIVGLFAFYTLLQSPLSAVKTYVAEYFHDYTGAYSNILGFSHPRMESEIRAFVGIIPLQDMVNEFIIGLRADVSSEEFLTMVLQYIRLKLIAHVQISEPIIRQLAESIIQSPMKTNIFEENARLRTFFAIPNPLAANLSKIGIKKVYAFLIEPMHSQLHFNDMAEKLRTICQSKCRFTTIYTPKPKQIHVLLESYKKDRLISDYAIAINTNQELKIYSISIPNFDTNETDFNSIDLGVLDFIILNLFEMTAVKDYSTQVDFFEHFVQLTENRLNFERKRIKEILNKTKNGHMNQPILENYLGYRIIPSAMTHILENLQSITLSLSAISRDEIIKRSNLLLNNNYLQYNIHRNFYELLVTSPKIFKITLLSSQIISNLIENHLLFCRQFGEVYNIVGDFMEKLPEKLGLLLSIPVYVFEFYIPFEKTPIFYLRYDFLEDKWADYINFVPIQAENISIKTKNGEQLSFPDFGEKDFGQNLEKSRAKFTFQPISNKDAIPFLQELWLHYHSEEESIQELFQALLPTYSFPSVAIRPRHIVREKIIILIQATHYYLNPHFVEGPIKELLPQATDFYYFGGYLFNILLLEFLAPREDASQFILQLKSLEKQFELRFDIWVQVEEKRTFNSTLLFSPVFQVQTYNYLRFPKSLAPQVSTQKYSRDVHELIQAAGYIGYLMLLVYDYRPLASQLQEFYESVEMCKIYSLESEKKDRLGQQDLMILFPVRDFQPLTPVIWELIQKWGIQEKCFLSSVFNRTDFGWL